MDAAGVAAAAFAPAVVWLLWRLQSLSVDKVLRVGMYKLLRHQRATYNVVSWFGVLLHEISHAFFLLVGGHGIRRFKVGVDSGHVVPSQVRRGPLGVLTFVIAALAPMFVAPAIILGVTWWLLDPDLIAIATAAGGWDTTWPVLRDMAIAFPLRLAAALGGLDITTWQGIVVAALVIFALPSARPSFVAGGKGENDQGDIAVVRAKVRRRPVTFLVVAALLVASYGVVWWRPALYWAPWQAVWGTAMTAIILATVAGLGWATVARAGRITWWLAWVPWASALAVQILARTDAGYDAPLWQVNAATLVVFAGLAWGLSLAASRRW